MGTARGARMPWARGRGLLCRLYSYVCDENKERDFYENIWPPLIKPGVHQEALHQSLRSTHCCYCYEWVALAAPMSQIGTSMSQTATALYSGVLDIESVRPSTACIPAAQPGRESFVAVST